MKKAVWATFYHKASTDDEPKHHLCPEGEKSWCGFQRAKFTGEKYIHKNSVPSAVMDLVVKPIFNDLCRTFD